MHQGSWHKVLFMGRVNQAKMANNKQLSAGAWLESKPAPRRLNSVKPAITYAAHSLHWYAVRDTSSRPEDKIAVISGRRWRRKRSPKTYLLHYITTSVCACTAANYKALFYRHFAAKLTKNVKAMQVDQRRKRVDDAWRVLRRRSLYKAEIGGLYASRYNSYKIYGGQ